jgi:hypothetical protein
MRTESAPAISATERGHAPADSPNRVTLRGFPPNAAMFRRTLMVTKTMPSRAKLVLSTQLTYRCRRIRHSLEHSDSGIAGTEQHAGFDADSIELSALHGVSKKISALNAEMRLTGPPLLCAPNAGAQRCIAIVANGTTPVGLSPHALNGCIVWQLSATSGVGTCH